MDMGNNRGREGFVEERLDRFFAFLEWLCNYPNAMVHYIQKQTSNHCLLILEDNPPSFQTKKSFYFNKRMLALPNFENVLNKAWNVQQRGSSMFQVCKRIKTCRVALSKLKGMYHLYSGQVIRVIKGKI